MVAGASFVVRIPDSIYNEMLEHIVAGYPNEACGVLGCTGNEAVKNYPTVNAAEHPDDFSIVSDEDLKRIFYDVDEYGDGMIYYHSHPRSEAYPSPRDIEWAKHVGYVYIIFSHQYHPEPPSCRVFKIDINGTITEGEIKRF